jgi:hypothetical protein
MKRPKTQAQYIAEKECDSGDCQDYFPSRKTEKSHKENEFRL